MKFPIVENAKRQARMTFLGIAIPCQKTLADGEFGPIRCEKVLKFNRKALRNIGKRKVTSVDSRYVGGEDTMIVKVGKPGSKERVLALAEQYAKIAESGIEVSPFACR